MTNDRLIHIIIIVILINMNIVNYSIAQEIDEIRIGAGDLNEITLNKDKNKPLKIILTGSEYIGDHIYIISNTILTGINNTKIYAQLVIQGENIIVSNITINIIPPGAGVAMYVLESNNVTIRNITIYGGPVIIKNSSNIKILNIKIYNINFPVFTIENSTNIIIDIIEGENIRSLADICNSKSIKIYYNNEINNKITMCKKQKKQEIELKQGNYEQYNNNKTITNTNVPTAITNIPENSSKINGIGAGNKRLIYYSIVLVIILAVGVVYGRKVRQRR